MFAKKLNTFYSKNRQRNGSKVQPALYDRIMLGSVQDVNIPELPMILDSIRKANSHNRINEIFELIILAFLTAVFLFSIVKNVMAESYPHIIPIGFLALFATLTLILLLRHFKIKKKDNEIYSLAADGFFQVLQYRITEKQRYECGDCDTRYMLTLNDFAVEISYEIYERVDKGCIVSAVLIMYKDSEYFYLAI